MLGDSPTKGAYVRKILLLLIAILVISPMSLIAAPAQATTHSCSDWSRWHDAQKWYLANDPAHDLSHLDSDRDGYACEGLAERTPVGSTSGVGSAPGCYDGKCAGRNQYRKAFWLSSRWYTYPGGITGRDMEAVRAALLDTFAPQASRSSEVRSMLEHTLGTINPNNSNCVRQKVLNFIKYQNSAHKTSDAFVKVFGTGQIVVKVARATTGGLSKPVTWWINEYMKRGKDLALTASKISVAESSKGYLADAMDC
jgi:hypothetical protein